MLSSQQMDLISGITCNYQDYVVYYYADYHDYQVNEPRDSRIVIYVGSGFTYEDGTFQFGDDYACYHLTYSKYLDQVPAADSFTVPASQFVYTNLVAKYPDLSFWETKFNHLPLDSLIVGFVLGFISILVITRVLFGGKS